MTEGDEVDDRGFLRAAAASRRCRRDVARGSGARGYREGL